MSRASNQQQQQQQATSGGRQAASHQHRTSTPSRILDELLALGPELAPGNVTVLDYRHSKWRQEADEPDGAFSSQLAQALGECGLTSAAAVARHSPAPSATSNKTLTPPLALADDANEQQLQQQQQQYQQQQQQQQHFSFDPFQPASGVKILDIRRTKTDRRRPVRDGSLAVEVDEDEPPLVASSSSAELSMRGARSNNQQRSSQNQPPQQQQRQQSGETLSSYESDYDLLVYLGETETEDIVDTERSLDYQDQTWRQSICGGASLAPTIDESLSELLSTGNLGSTNQLLAGTSVTPTRLNVATSGQQQQQQHQPASRHRDTTTNAPNDDFDLLWTPTNTLRSGQPASASARRQVTPVDSAHNQSSALAGNWPATSSSSSSLPRPLKQPAPSRVGDAQRRAQSRTLNVQRSAAANQLGQAPSYATNQPPSAPLSRDVPTGGNNKLGLGEKLVSLFNRKDNEQQSASNSSRQQTGRKVVEPATSFGFREDHSHQQASAHQQLWAAPAYLPTVQPPRQLARGGQYRGQVAMTTPGRRPAEAAEMPPAGADNAAELDRLLAEMSQSLDLDSLARYDPFKGRSPQAQAKPQQPQQPRQVRQMQNASNNHQQETRQLGKSSQQITNATTGKPNVQAPRQATGAQPAEPSILDEYDGASKILEQMISDQLEESAHRAPPPATDTVSRQRRKVAASVSSQTDSPSRKISSSSAATTETSVIPNPLLVKLNHGKPSGELYENNQPPVAAEQRPIGPSSNRTIKIEPGQAPGEVKSALRHMNVHTSGFNSDSQTQAESKLKLTKGTRSFDVPDVQSQVKPAPARPQLITNVLPAGSPSTTSQTTTTNRNSPPRVVDLSRQAKMVKRLPNTRRRGASTSSSSSSSSSVSSGLPPPKPPAPDYHDDNAATVGLPANRLSTSMGKSNVIQVEAADMPSSSLSSASDNEDEASNQNKSMMNKMKRRTLSSMRSVRNKISDLTSPKRDSIRLAKGELARPSANSFDLAAPQVVGGDVAVKPKPPKRSSSIGSNRSANNSKSIELDQLDARLKSPEPLGDTSPRQSRGRERRRVAPISSDAEPNPSQAKSDKSFGQQLRERLSRSKSRFSNFLNSPQLFRRRAQSTPDEQRARISANMISAPMHSNGDELPLFQPGDIARNTPIQEVQRTSGQQSALSSPDAQRRRDHFDSSLERHLMASLEPKKPLENQAQLPVSLKIESPLKNGAKHSTTTATSKDDAKSPSSSSSSSSELSGLDTTKDTKLLSRFELPPITRSARAAKRRRQQIKTPNELTDRTSAPRTDGADAKQRRPTSLISLKRLSSSFGKKDQLGPPIGARQVEDLDSMKVSTGAGKDSSSSSPNLAHVPAGLARLSKRRAKRRQKSNLSERKASPESALTREQLLPKRTTTDDYFGLVAPPVKPASESPETAKAPTPIHLRIEMGPRVRPASALGVDNQQLATTTTPGQSRQQGRNGHLPHRTQSLKGQRPSSGGADVKLAHELDVGKRGQTLPVSDQLNQHKASVSFQDLQVTRPLAAINQRRQLSPASPNTFRPMSATPTDIAAARKAAPFEDSQPTVLVGGANEVTPIPPNQTVAAAKGPPEALASSLLEAPTEARASTGTRSPMRDRGAALLGDIRSRYHELFKSSPTDSKTTNSAQQARSISPAPSRPPRRRRRDPQFVEASRRSRSLAAGELAARNSFDEDDDGEQTRRPDGDQRFIEVEASSPPASLLAVESPRTQSPGSVRSRSVKQPAGKRFVEFAHQLKSSAADFFHAKGPNLQSTSSGAAATQQPTNQAATEAKAAPPAVPRQRPFLRNIDEPIRQDDLSHWRPIIQRSRATNTSSPEHRKEGNKPARAPLRSSSFRVLKDQNVHGPGLEQGPVSIDEPTSSADSTWQSSDSSASSGSQHKRQDDPRTTCKKEDESSQANKAQGGEAAQAQQVTEPSEQLADVTAPPPPPLSALARRAPIEYKTTVLHANSELGGGGGGGGSGDGKVSELVAPAAAAGSAKAATAPIGASGAANKTTTAPERELTMREELAGLNKETSGRNLITSGDRNNNIGDKVAAKDQLQVQRVDAATAAVAAAAGSTTSEHPGASYQKLQLQLQQRQQKIVAHGELKPSASDRLGGLVKKSGERQLDDVQPGREPGKQSQVGQFSTSDKTPSNKVTRDQHQDDSSMKFAPNQAPKARQTITRFEPNEFRFNKNLPSPSELHKDGAKLGASQPSNKSQLLQRQLDDVDLQFLKATSHRRAAASELKVQDSQAEPHTDLTSRVLQEQDDDSQQNRLSIYENVSQHEQQRPTKAADQGAQAVRPQHLATSDLLKNETSRDAKREAAAVAAPPASEKDDDWSVEPDDRLVERQAARVVESISPLDSRLTRREANNEAEDEDEQQQQRQQSSEVRRSAVSRRPERRLVSMTSIIHEPEDDLMNVSSSNNSQKSQRESTNKASDSASNQGITIDDLNDLLDNQGNSDLKLKETDNDDDGDYEDDDEEDSFAVAAASRQLLMNRFERRQPVQKSFSDRKLAPAEPVHKRSASVKQQVAAFQPAAATSTTTTAAGGGGPPRVAPRPAGVGGSLVQRLAKNFDQTVRDQPAAAVVAARVSSVNSSLKATPPAANASPTSPAPAPLASAAKGVLKGAATANTPGGSGRHSLRALASLELDEPKSDSTWYDAKSVELLDEAEVAELLREFEAEGRQAGDEQTGAAASPSRQANESQATDHYLSAGEQPAEGGGGDDDETLSQDDDTGRKDNQADGADDDDDPTLNDDETLNEDDQTEADGQADLTESIYVSANTSAAQPAHTQQVEALDKQGNDLTSPQSNKLSASPAGSGSYRPATSSPPTATAATTTAATAAAAAKISPAEARDILNAPSEAKIARANLANDDDDGLAHQDHGQLLLSPSANQQNSPNKISGELDELVDHSHEPIESPTVETALFPKPLSPPTCSRPASSREAQQADTNLSDSQPAPNVAPLKQPNNHTPLCETTNTLKKEQDNDDDERLQDPIKRTIKSRRARPSASTSMFSASLSSTDSLNHDDLMAFEALNSKSLVRAAKKCSRLYEELERLLLARARVVNQQQQQQEAAQSSTSPRPSDLAGPKRLADGHSARDCEPHDYDLDDDDDHQEEEAMPTHRDTQVQADGGRRGRSNEEDENDVDDDEDDQSAITDLTSDQSSSRGDDQISLSSSSLSSETLPEIKQRQNLQKLYNIVNEICTSEEKFLATLKLLNVDFRQHIYTSIVASSSGTGGGGGSQLLNSSSSGKAQQQQVLQQQLLFQQAPYDCIGSILKHLPQLQALNENLLGELKRAREQWPKTQKISHVLVKIGPFLKHYSSYIRDFELIQTQYQDNLKKYPQFSELITSFERDQADKCQKLSVQHHLLRPIQRIPQYRLLLQQYLHHLKPDDADYEDTVEALEVVSRVAEHANQSLNEGANFAKLLALQAKIVGKQRDIIQPGRLFVREGELLKVCRKQIQPRWLVLLSDSLLYLKQIQSSDILYLKYELPLDDCQVGLPSEEEAAAAAAAAPQTSAGQQHESQRTGPPVGSKEANAPEQAEREFNIRTTVRSMTLVAKSRQERDDWLESLRSTIGDHVAKRRSFKQASADNNNDQDHNGAVAIQQIAGSLTASSRLASSSSLPELVGRKAPIWTPDARVATCQLCTSNFSALFRRHHCRACGRLVCSACSSNRAPLIYLKCRAARVCDQCFEQLRANMHLYYLPSSQIDERELKRLDEHFKTLLKSQFVKHVIGWSKSAKSASSSSSSKKPLPIKSGSGGGGGGGGKLASLTGKKGHRQPQAGTQPK